MSSSDLAAKKIGFLSFGAWHPGGGMTHTAGDALQQTVELAVAAEEIGIDGTLVQLPGLVDRIWWGSGTRESAVWGAERGMNLMSSTLLLEDTQVPFDELQAEQIALFHEAWQSAGHERNPSVSVSRSVMPITSDLARRLFGRDENEDQAGGLDGAISRFGRSYSGERDRIAEELANDAAVQAADTVLLTAPPSQLGVEYKAQMLDTIAREVAPAFGWRPEGTVSESASRNLS